MRSTFRILFYVNKQRAKDDRVPIYVRLTVNGKSRLWKGRDQVYSGSLGNLPDGKVKVDVKLLNLKNKTILAEKTFHLFVKKGEPGGNSSRSLPNAASAAERDGAAACGSFPRKSWHRSWLPTWPAGCF